MNIKGLISFKKSKNWENWLKVKCLVPLPLLISIKGSPYFLNDCHTLVIEWCWHFRFTDMPKNWYTCYGITLIPATQYSKKEVHWFMWNLFIHGEFLLCETLYCRIFGVALWFKGPTFVDWSDWKILYCNLWGNPIGQNSSIAI